MSTYLKKNNITMSNLKKYSIILITYLKYEKVRYVNVNHGLWYYTRLETGQKTINWYRKYYGADYGGKKLPTSNTTAIYI